MKVAGAVLLSLVCLIGIELIGRAAVSVLAGEETKAHLEELAARTYPENAKIRAHPFLQYTGNRDANNLGFVGEPDFSREKAPGTVRIATLGGSTTAEGNWPYWMQAWLDANAAGDPSFEVLNFGFVGYSSVHVLINFVLNVVDHDPDYVVVHSGWNDSALRGFDEPLSTDFHEVFRLFEFPLVADRWLIRASIVYRLVQSQLVPHPTWLDLHAAMYVGGISSRGRFDDPSELRPYRRNLEKILRLAKLRGIRVVLTTIPHTTNRGAPNFVEAEHIDQCNEVVRDLYRKHAGAGVSLVDLDEQITGEHDELFTDLAHMDTPGHQVKAELIGRIILEDVRQ